MAQAVPVPSPSANDLKRFFSKVIKHEDGCWEWAGARFRQGYGMFYLDGKARRAHRVLYVWTYGEPRLGLDHECRNRWCVNPDHLAPKTTKENVLAGVGPTARNAKKERCVNDHEFTPENTYVDPRGWRQCRTCMRDAQLRYRGRVRDARQKHRVAHAGLLG